MDARNFAVTSLFVASAVVAGLLVRSGAGATAPMALTPDARLAELERWSPILQRGGTVKIVRRPCDRDRAQHLARTGEPAPEFVGSGKIVTFGPIAGTHATELARGLEQTAAGTLERAERMVVEDIVQARAQLADIVHGLKARAAAVALHEGRYWTVGPTARVPLPASHSFWRFARVHERADGTRVDVFVPIDLGGPHLAQSYEALLSLEAELRREQCGEFNRLAFDERKALYEAARAITGGESAEREVPEWYWKLRVDATTLLATPVPVRE